MNSITTPLQQVKSHYDVIVIGSGYGGGVSASRMARAGRSVCLLERGKEILAPNFPDTLATAQAEMQLNTPVGKFGSATGLFDFQVNDDVSALVGCGLGGTSLINANVALEVDERVFKDNHWPAEYRDGELLKPYYQRAREVLGSTPYPRDDLNKLKALQKSAEAMNTKFYKPPINVTFEDGVNEFNVEQKACNNCGDCCSGCNNLAKNTTQMNYLPDAKNHGAEIFCETRAEKIAKNTDGSWSVYVTDLANIEDSKAPSGDGKELVISAAKVMVCAGTLGSTELLLRSQSDSLKFSDTLGERFSSNGDVLAFGYNNYWDTDNKNQPKPLYGVGLGANTQPKEVYPGPCITGVIDNRDAVSVQDGRVIEEGVIPGALAITLPPAFFFAGTQYGDFVKYGFEQAATRLRDAQKLGELITEDPEQLTQQAYQGPVSRTQTYLVMSYDDSAGKLYLDKDNNIRSDWKGAGRSHSVLKDNAALKEANAAIEGQFISNPAWSEPLDYKLVTVHPLGGCCMAESGEQGVVSPLCEVFEGNNRNIHEGLYVLDGSVLPTSVGVNPLLAITAIAEYAVEKLADKNGWEIDYGLSAAKPIKMGPEKIRPVKTGPEKIEPVKIGPAKIELEKTEPVKITPVKTEPVKAESIETEDGDHVSNLASSVATKARQIICKLLCVFKKLFQYIRAKLLDIGTAIFRKLVKLFPSFFSPGFSFTETMRGFITDELDANSAPPQERIVNDYQLSFAQGRSDGNDISYKLTVSTPDLYTFTETRSAEITGEVYCKLISNKPLKVTNGRFSLFNPDPDNTETWVMSYQLNLKNEDGIFYFDGNKYLHQETGSHWWTDVTTLFVDIYRGNSSDTDPVVQGVMILKVNDAITMAQTIKTPMQRHEHGIKKILTKVLTYLIKKFPRIETTLDTVFMTKFAGFFAETIFKSYGGLLSDLKNFPRDENTLARQYRRNSSLPDPEITVLTTADGAKIKLYRYRHGDGRSRRQVVLAPGFSVTADSFATKTVDVNLVEYLYAGTGNTHSGDVSGSAGTEETGFDVWLFAYRASPDSENQLTDYTIDDIVDHDWPRAISYILEQSGKESISAIVHCVGSMTLLMALLKGLKGIDSVISSQLTLHPVTNWLNFLKADVDLVKIISDGLPSTLPDLTRKIPLRPDTDNSDKSVALDVLCWSVPVPEGEECKNPVCHRITSIFGQSYTHTQLNHETHIAMEEWFDEIALRPFEQLLKIINKQHVVDAAGEDTYLEKVENLKLPIHFVAGAVNKIFLPETSLRTYEWLKAHNGSEYYSRKVFPDYAHMDFFIGKNASRDIFPYFSELLNKQKK